MNSSRHIAGSVGKFVVFFSLAAFVTTTFADEDVLSFAHSASALFADTIAPYSVNIEAGNVQPTSIGWTFTLSGRTVASGESEVDANRVAQFKLPIPPVKPGASLDGALHVVARVNDKDLGNTDKQITVFPKDAFSPLRSTLNALELPSSIPPNRRQKSYGIPNFP